MDLLIKKSKIHGQGLFANHDFKKGEVVVRWDSCSQEVNPTTRLSAEDKTRILSLGEKRLLLTSPNRYLNHSCQANTNVVDGYDVATRDIKKGEEVTSNYATQRFFLLKMECNCGSKKCQKTIFDEQL